MPGLDRRGRLRSAFPENLDAFLLTHGASVRWATGFAGSNGAAMVTAYGRDLLATDGRYRLRAATEAPDIELLIARKLGAELIAAAAASGSRRIGFEADRVSVSSARGLMAAAETAGVELVECVGVVESCRAAKDPDEIQALRAACEITDAAFSAVLETIRVGVTERDVEWALIGAMRMRGADGPAFDAIVASGPNSAIPHHSPGDRQLQTGDFLTLDFGARVAGYHADMTRTVVIGRPADWQRDLYALVNDIQATLRGQARTGAVPVDLNAAASRMITDNGYDVAHGLGHGVGLEIHEEPWLIASSVSSALVAGIPVTIEPGIYLDGRGGVRIEDTTLITDTHAEPLTTSTRELLEV